MTPIIRLAQDTDRDQVIAILNHYILSGMAAYPQTPVPPQAWEGLKSLCRDGNLWVAEVPDKGVVGFAMLKWYMGKESFAHTAETGYFLLPDATGSGIGTLLLKALEDTARQLGINILVANISSQNPESLAFHNKLGFTECGRLHNVGKKHDRFFDVVWVTKTL